MDHWISDDSIYISRKSGTSDGVVQVYKHNFPDSPLGDYSFSLIGEADTLSAIAPSVVWENTSYLRLIEYLEFNSAMVTASGHLILRSQIRVGGRDGPATYWRCLDLLPMHAFGLTKPLDTGKRSMFLIVGGEVEKSVSDDGGWKSKYDTLDTEYTTLMTKYGNLNDELTASTLKNDKLVLDAKAFKPIEEERDRLKNSLGALKDEVKTLTSTNTREARISKDTISKLQDKLNDSVTKAVSNQLMMKEVDIWCTGIAFEIISEKTVWKAWVNPKVSSFKRLYELTFESTFSVEGARFCGKLERMGTWKVYMRNRLVTFICDEPYKDDATYVVMYDSNVFGWNGNINDRNRRLCGRTIIKDRYYS